MTVRYVPILRWKHGERRGLSQLQPDTKAGVIPLFQLGPDQFHEPHGKKAEGISAAEAFAIDVLADWGTSPFYLDASELRANDDTAHHPLVDIAAQARLSGLRLIPATSLTSANAYLTAVAVIARADGRGAALRVRLEELANLPAWLSTLPVPPKHTDLIADLRDSIGVVECMGAAAIATFQNLHEGSQWRTVVVAGTSMPPDFGGRSAGVYFIPRSEWTFWKKLSVAGLPYALGYGDYATVSLAPPPPAIAWGYPINVKYTLTDRFMVCKGVKTRGRGSVDMGPQLIQHAHTIKSFPERGRIDGCWGDDLIDDVATGIDDPGSLEIWVRGSVNRHIERVRADLP